MTDDANNPSAAALAGGARELPDVLSAEDVSRMFHVGVSGARRMILRDFPHVRMGKRNFVLRSAFLDTLKARELPPSVAPSAPLRFDAGLKNLMRRNRPRVSPQNPARKEEAGVSVSRASSIP
jgi:hypothetical protein